MVKHKEIAGKIVDYLSTKPEKEDSLEGIADWWMKSDKGSHAIVDLEDALNLMLSNGELEKLKVQKDVIVYRVKKR